MNLIEHLNASDQTEIVFSRSFLNKMFALPEYSIAFEGLKERVYEYDYSLGAEFFDAMGNDEILQGDVKAKVSLEKSVSMLVADVTLEGSLVMPCDRCNENVEVPIKGGLKQIYKLLERDDYDSEEVILLGSNEHEIDITGPIYECLILALPSRKVHEETACDPEVLKALGFTANDNEKTDPRWNVLRGMTG